MRTTIVNQDGKVVVDGEATAMATKEEPETEDTRSRVYGELKLSGLPKKRGTAGPFFIISFV